MVQIRLGDKLSTYFFAEDRVVVQAGFGEVVGFVNIKTAVYLDGGGGSFGVAGFRPRLPPGTCTRSTAAIRRLKSNMMLVSMYSCVKEPQTLFFLIKIVEVVSLTTLQAHFKPN